MTLLAAQWQGAHRGIGVRNNSRAAADNQPDAHRPNTLVKNKSKRAQEQFGPSLRRARHEKKPRKREGGGSSDSQSHNPSVPRSRHEGSHARRSACTKAHMHEGPHAQGNIRKGQTCKILCGRRLTPRARHMVQNEVQDDSFTRGLLEDRPS